jgi:uncharacterized protein YjbI with pentapeptide repeats
VRHFLDSFITSLNFYFTSFCLILIWNDYSNANFSDTWISETDFTGSNFTGARFHKAHIDSGDFTNANLTDTDFKNAVFFYSPKYLNKIRGSIVNGANFEETIFFIRRVHEPLDLDVSEVPGAICVSCTSDLANLDLDKYRPSAIEEILESLRTA